MSAELEAPLLEAVGRCRATAVERAGSIFVRRKALESCKKPRLIARLVGYISSVQKWAAGESCRPMFKLFSKENFLILQDPVAISRAITKLRLRTGDIQDSKHPKLFASKPLKIS